MCFVGTLSSHSLAVFLLIPITIYVSIGTVLFLAGFISLFRIRTVMKSDGTRTDKLEKLMIRIGIFSTLFVISSVMYISALVYEYINFDDWMQLWNRNSCKKFSIPCPPPMLKDQNEPNFYIFIFKYLSVMFIGTTSGVTWLCSGKTLSSWKIFFQRMKGKGETGNFV